MSGKRAVVAEPSANERFLRESLEQLAKRALQEGRASDAEQLAGKLGMVPYGVEVLLEREEWALETSIRVANALGYEVTMTAARNGG